ncbi:hypothetical protein [Nocardia jiangsuensis]|uniref:AAA ATPase-like protein n=1 Tax=Nocardia jiangsuensis TaxID=1691563 RepID=A0ABV8DQ70_9NOCA
MVDEMPWLVERDPEFEDALQTMWDRHLSGKPVLLLLVGSDISVMEALGSRDRPFVGRATTMTVEPLHVADVQSMTGLDAADAIALPLSSGTGSPTPTSASDRPSWSADCRWSSAAAATSLAPGWRAACRSTSTPGPDDLVRAWR